MTALETQRAIKESEVSAGRAITAYNMAMQEWRKALLRLDWSCAEQEHIKAIENLSAHLDHIQVVYRLRDTLREPNAYR
jgi:hypothetical protein